MFISVNIALICNVNIMENKYLEKLRCSRCFYMTMETDYFHSIDIYISLSNAI